MSKINGILFHVRWVFMSPEKKYLYLWHRTKRAMKQAAYTSPVPLPCR
jgi:hypothetical protein